MCRAALSQLRVRVACPESSKGVACPTTPFEDLSVQLGNAALLLGLLVWPGRPQSQVLARCRAGAGSLRPASVQEAQTYLRQRDFEKAAAAFQQEIEDWEGLNPSHRPQLSLIHHPFLTPLDLVGCSRNRLFRVNFLDDSRSDKRVHDNPRQFVARQPRTRLLC